VCEGHSSSKAGNCIKSIQDWSSSHCLKLNAAKSEVIWLGTRQQLVKLSEADKTLQIDNTTQKPSTVDQNLSMLINKQLSMDAKLPTLISVRRLASFTCSGSANCVATSC